MGKKHKKQQAVPETGAGKIRTHIVNIYLLAIFMIVPLIFKNGFEMIGTFKYRTFRNLSLLFIAVIALLTLAGILARRRREGGAGFLIRELHELPRSLSATDKFVLAYLICILISFLLAEDKAAAWKGAGGWYMGLLSQLIFLASYFIVSRFWDRSLYVWYGACGAAFAAFVLAVLHRFSIDPLHMYNGFPEGLKIQYLSVLGQNTWYSSYMCTLFPLGFLFFYCGKKARTRLLGGVFTAAGFATYVTQNSDSAYIALAALLFVLFWIGFESNQSMERFLETVILMLFMFECIGFCQQLFSDRAVELEGLSVFMSQSAVTGVMLFLFCILYLVFYKAEKKGWTVERLKPLRVTALIILITIIVFMVSFIILNTTGMLEKWLGIRNTNNYLLFDETWGNGRGRTWSFSVKLLKEFPFYRKLFGAGPDCFSSYAYAIPSYAARLREMWGQDTLTNAHNEWLNSLICYGLAGTAAYAGIFVTAFKSFLGKRRENPLLIAAALTLVSYAGHNFFCYQQVLCTPFLFLILGMGESLVRQLKSKENGRI